MSIKKKLKSILLSPGVSYEYECDGCGERFDERIDECPECGSTGFTEVAAKASRRQGSVRK